MSAIAAIAGRLSTGDHVVVTDNTYGGTFRLFDKVLTRYGLEFTYVDTSDLDATARAITPRTKLVFIETPTNPVLRLTDIAAVAALANTAGATLVVDNTFASPCLQRPIALGAHLVVHSTTKYLNGHSDSIGGVVIATREDDIEWLRFIQNSAGAILSPFDSWLILRGTKTLNLRMKQHTINGLAIAQFLETHPKVTKVIYPGLPSHPQYELAQRQMPNGAGGMLSFEVASLDEARQVLNRFKLMALAESLGGVETLVCHPASMTHASVEPERRKAIGLSDSLIRISAGIEDPDDLIDDLRQALG
jgi:cystathionine gamma-lyase/cystathionine beta-lyase/cystathionine gamma-lyase/homocysteine desulfhydrase